MIVARQAKLILILSAMLALSACSPKEARRVDQEGPKDWSAKQELPEKPDAEISVDMKQINESLKANGKTVLAQVVQPLSKQLLNRSVLEGSKDKYAATVTLLTKLNEGIIRIYEENPRTVSDEEVYSVLKLYEAAVFDNCDDQMNVCPRTGFFRRDPRSARVMFYISTTLDRQIDTLVADIEKQVAVAREKEAEKLKKDPKAEKTPIKSVEEICVKDNDQCRSLLAHKYRLLAMALLLRSNAYNDKELAFSYLKHARIYSRLVYYRDHEMTDKRPLSYLDMVHDNLMETTIAYFQPKDIGSEEFCKFVDRFGAWTFSQKLENKARQSTRKMFEYATKCSLYKADGTISQSLSDAITLQQTTEDDAGRAFAQITADIWNDPATQGVFANFDLQAEAKAIVSMDKTFLDEYFFIVDRLYRDHLYLDDAKKILQSTRKESSNKILKTAAAYAKITLIQRIVDTNKELAQISTQSTVSSEYYLQDMFNKSRLIEQRWQLMQRRLSAIDTLLGSYFKQSGRKNADYEEVHKMFAGISRNIHYFAIYPNMMMLTYYLADKRAVMKAKKWSGEEQTVAPDTIIQDFLTGSYGPWFKYAENTEKLPRTMLLYAYYYALATNAFETFGSYKSSIGELPVSHLGFFQKVVTKYLGLDKQKLDGMISDLSEDPLQSPDFKKLKRVCPYELGQSNVRPSEEISLLALRGYTYMGNAQNDTIEAGGPISRAFTYMKTLPDSLFSIRDYIQPRLSLVKGMAGILKKQYSGKDPNLIADVEKLISEIETKIEHVYGLAYDINQNLFPCILRIQDLEEYRQYRLYDKEREHLGSVYDQMQDVLKLPETGRAAKITEINNTDFKNSRFDRIQDEDTYFYSQYDMLVRVADNMQKDIFRQPTEDDIKIYDSKDLAYFNKPRGISVFENSGIERQDIITKKKGQPLHLSASSSRESFIDQGISYLNGSEADSLLGWWRKNSDGPMFHQLKIRTAMDLFLAGSVKTLDVSRPECLNYQKGELPEKCHLIRDLSADAVIQDQINMLNYLRIDQADKKNMTSFGAISKFELTNKSDLDQTLVTAQLTPALAGVLLENNSGRPMPPFFYLTQILARQSNLSYNTQYDEVKGDDALHLVQNAFFIAQTSNNMESLMFTPKFRDEDGKPAKDKTTIGDILKEQYGESVNRVYNRAQAMITQIRAKESSPEMMRAWEPIEYKLEGGRYLTLDTQKTETRLTLMEDQKAEDFRIRRLKFINETQNFFKTQEAVQEHR